ncbi:MAG TPA: hypothetical protein VHK05_01820 [Candidatus Limnocylindrales bacterium]|nr:hypothetical protein [Candidatus Limnocylindrales bacterium]
MRLVVASVALVVGVSILLPPATAPTALGQDASVEPSASASASESAEPSGSPLPDAHITLAPAVEAIPFRTWAVAVTGGTSSVDVLEAEDMGSGFSVTVFGQTATVELTLTLPPDLQLVADCFDFDNQVPIGAVEPPQRFVLQVVQGGSYECRYGSECAGPSGPPQADVGLYASTGDFDVSPPWPIMVTGGRAVAFGCSGGPIAALTLRPDPEIPELLFGVFAVESVAESASVEMTAPRPKGGRVLVSARCEDQTNERFFDALVRPRQLVFDVVPGTTYICDTRARSGALPPTDTLAGPTPRQSSGSWPTVLAGLAGVVAASLLILVRARRERLR